ncbi:alkaline phosphatase family protein [Paenibacillus sp. GCM10012303]|uniref:alkaline phosphatase family protein n=1 Tax=Paenibacillus sp. GCM10012303 TaxID=3317340 RepID=UPI0036D2184C
MEAGKKIAVVLTIGLCFTLFLTGCRAKSGSNAEFHSKSELQIKSATAKPVVAIIIDSLMDKPLQDALAQGKAPALKYLIDNGHYFPNVISSFPTMSVTIDSSLLTGVYADGHRVPGLVWYSDREKRMVFYGNGPKEALKIDQLQVLEDSVYHLNQLQLSKNVKTVHEELADSGKQSASINALIYRGRSERDVRIPESMANTSRLPVHYKITAPPLFSYAALAQLNPANANHTEIWEKYGMNDEFSARDIAYLVKERKLPEATIAYFPENDNIVHRKGAKELKGIEQADRSLQTVFNAYGLWEEAVRNTVWIILGDSAQSDVQKDRDLFRVDLRSLLKDYRIAKLGKPVGQDDQIVIAANERMAYIYALSPDLKLTDLIGELQAEDKFDIIAAKQDDSVMLTAGGRAGSVLTYRPGGANHDEYGQAWSLTGEPSLADISLNGTGIQYGKYPDVLARLYGALHSHEGRYIVVTVKPGYELAGESSSSYRGGGAHGSLHEADSVVPLIVAGTDSKPKSLRIVDMKSWILQLTGQ